MRQAEDIRLETRAGTVALLHWAPERAGAPNVLCLHGWLDNAASFVPLAQHLHNLNVYALDFPGHGHSDHRPPGVRYAFTEYLFDLDAVLEAMEWERANLLGHSMGGGVACIYAAAAPERVRRIAIADGLGPVSGNEADTPRQIRKSLEWVRRQRRPLRRFKSIDEMATARENSFLRISHEAATLICERAARPVSAEEGQHFLWRTDPALKWDSPVLLSEAQVLNCLEQVEAPMLSFHAQTWSSFRGPQWIERRKAAARHGTFREVDGNHHFHMDGAETIAPEIETFFLEDD